MGRIWLYFVQLRPAGVVKTLHQFGVTFEGFGGGDILQAVVFPQAVIIAKGTDTGFGRNAGSGQYHNMLWY